MSLVEWTLSSPRMDIDIEILNEATKIIVFQYRPSVGLNMSLKAM